MTYKGDYKTDQNKNILTSVHSEYIWKHHCFQSADNINCSQSADNINGSQSADHISCSQSADNISCSQSADTIL